MALPALVEFAVFVSGHRRNPEPWISAIVLALYLAFPKFVTTVLPLVQQSYLVSQALPSKTPHPACLVAANAPWLSSARQT